VETVGDSKTPLFTFVESSHSGLEFRNNITIQKEVNVYNYINVYNGGGVAIGDINNDGLSDIFFTGNMVPCKLYLNKGDLKFEDITEQAGVDGQGGWCTGVTMADVNADGLLDIYVSRSFSDKNSKRRENLLYINNGDLSFTEQGRQYQVNDNSYSTQASFFDYDGDGDLDLYVGNHPRDNFIEEITDPRSRYKKLANPTMRESDHLFRNKGDGTFENVTEEAGILNYGFLLGIMTADLNQDGWVDIYVANDHQEPDCYYVNNGDGTFTNQIHTAVKHISNFAMGIDLADINNDGLPDIAVADMMAQDNYRQKTQMAAMAVETFLYMQANGFHSQYMRNTLQLNNGNGTFSEIGQLAGIDKTDWSWAVLLGDFDNDGYKDMFVSNGYTKDIRDKDYMHDFELRMDSAFRGLLDIDAHDLESMAGSTKLVNHLLMNNGQLTFTDRSAENGIAQASFSYGAAYADLDNDGDLELVINNSEDKAYLYRNNSAGKNYLRIKLEGQGANLLAFGAQVWLRYDDVIQYQEMTASRGFQSSVEPILHFGLAQKASVNLEVRWPNGKRQKIENVKANQLLVLREADASQQPDVVDVSQQQLFQKYKPVGIEFVHTENEFDDYAVEILLPHKMSRFGPSITSGDVNGDGTEDIYVGGALWQAGVLYLQQSDNSFIAASSEAFDMDEGREDLGCLFFDADGDEDLDLYVVSGGSEFSGSSAMLQDRLYLNDGKGNFTKSEDALPHIDASGSCVVAFDYDQDGDLDLFVGGRLDPGRYPYPGESYLLQNDNGKFTDVTDEMAPGLKHLGMVSSAVWTDHNSDGQIDLLVVGEWLPITVFENIGGKFENKTEEYGLANTLGWWNRIVSADFDGDGDDDYIAGNYGLNSKFKVSAEEPLHIYCHDFDASGSLDIVLGYYNQGTCYPVRGRQCSSEQMPNIKQKFPTYDAFGRASLADVYGDKLDQANIHYEAKMFATSYIENLGEGIFKISPLPIEAQFSTVFGLIPEDYDQDGNLDLLLAGNFYSPEVETGQNDASIGVLLKGDGSGGFASILGGKSGFFADLDVRDLCLIKSADGGSLVFVVNNDGPLQVYKLMTAKQKLIN